jgi:YD repeat-containing protein
MTDPTYGVATYGYDALNRKNSEVDSDGVSKQMWSYSGNTVTYTDEDGNQWQRTMDALGRLTKVLEPNGASTSPTMETDYAYDALNNLLSVNQWGGPNGTVGKHVRLFQYDSLSRLLTVSNPESGGISYSYDGNGNVQTKTDARSVTITYNYDALNRLLSKSYSGDSSNTPSSCYQYDSTSTLRGIGRLSNEWTQSASKGVCSTAAPSTGFITMRSFFAYDQMGRVLNEQQSTPASVAAGKVYAPGYTYDLAGNLITSTDGTTPSSITGTALTFTNSYDAAEHLLSVTSNWTDSTHPSTLFSLPTSPLPPCASSTTASYTPFGALQNATYGNGLTLNRGFDTRLRMTCEMDKGANAAATSGTATVTITGAEQIQ